MHMTIGQRIAQKRKELGLSQEALGEKLGVSRQSIYKWESDTALPEIDKLIALSRLFGLSVGTLLGVEDPAPAAEASQDGELTSAQLRMVEEITQRYLAAAPAAPASPNRRRRAVIAAALVLAAAWAGFSLNRRLEQMDAQYWNLSSSIQSVSQTVNGQINSITDKVESILKAQNDLTADYATEVVDMDLAGGLVTFSFRATPRTFTEGTVAYLEVSNEAVTVTYGPFVPVSGQTFTGQAQVALTDSIRLSVIFETDGVRSTQLLDTYTDLYTQSLPALDLSDNLWRTRLTQPYTLTLPNHDGSETVYIQPYMEGYTPVDGQAGARVAQVQVGLFKNQSLMLWADPIPVPEDYIGFDQCDFYRFPEASIPLTEGDVLCVAAVVTDTFGRTFVSSGACYAAAEDGTVLEFASGADLSPDPADWGV